ncbi:MAG: hypothetical protein WBO23_09265 [Burkholderiales bacterium]
MIRVRAGLVLLLAIIGLSASAPALAWHHGGHVRFGVVVGAPFYPWWYYPPAYYPPAIVTVPATPPTYIEQGSPQPVPAQQPQGYWYYCTDSKTYYPYVKECPGGWQHVAPQPVPGG